MTRQVHEICALITLALKKATDDDMNALYNIEDIYEWIDYVRRMGINQVFFIENIVQDFLMYNDFTESIIEKSNYV